MAKPEDTKNENKNASAPPPANAAAPPTNVAGAPPRFGVEASPDPNVGAGLAPFPARPTGPGITEPHKVPAPEGKAEPIKPKVMASPPFVADGSVPRHPDGRPMSLEDQQKLGQSAADMQNIRSAQNRAADAAGPEVINPGANANVAGGTTVPGASGPANTGK